jgi:hypothetical protein
LLKPGKKELKRKPVNTTKKGYSIPNSITRQKTEITLSKHGQKKN